MANAIGEFIKQNDEFFQISHFSFTGEHWKTTRSTFSPIFTSGKMKGMMALINEVNKKLLDSFETEAE